MDYTMSNNFPAWNPRCYIGKVGCNCIGPNLPDSVPAPTGTPATGASFTRAMNHVAARTYDPYAPVGYDKWAFLDWANSGCGTSPPRDTKLPPQFCIKCNYCNEYAGKEHLDSEGRYTCRTCKQNPYI